MNFAMLLSKLNEFISSQSVAVGEGLLILGLVIFVLIILRSWCRTSVNTCECFIHGYEAVVTEHGEYFKCNTCGGLFEFERGIPIKKILKFFFNLRAH